jgi:oligopeptidase B
VILKQINNLELFCEKAEPFIGVFASKKWLSVYGDALTLIGIYKDEHQLIGGFYFLNTKKYGFTFLKLPPYTPHCGLFFLSDSKNSSSINNFSKEVMSEVCTFFTNQKSALTVLAFPSSIIDFNMRTQEKIVLKEQEVLGGKFDKNNYIEERVWATATDGTKVPISIVYKKGIQKDGKNPLLLYAYGSYGATMDPYFSSTRLSLLDRGFIYAIAHIRGGEDLGREWYENGKLLQKKNTFTDYVDCSKFMIDQKYTSAEHLYAEGGSAGGLLMGAIVNMAPELYHGVIAQVPFVDVITTMLDDTIPLTTGEYDEWGNPNEKKYYDYMLSYSPYDQVKAQAYPNMYVSTGLHDSQVQYWEPAKWVAKLRVLKTNDTQLFLDTNMDAGHGGASGRFEALKELAKEFAFLLDLEKIKK